MVPHHEPDFCGPHPIEEKAKETVSAKSLPKAPNPNPKPVMTEKERQKRTAELATITVEWVRSLKLAPYDLEMFWGQVNSTLYGGLPWLFTPEAPKPGGINPGEDPLKVIERCKVTGGNPQFKPDVINNHVTWLAQWIQRVSPDWAVMKAALAQAEFPLRIDIRKPHKF